MASVKFLLSVNITIDCMNDRVKARVIKEEVYFFQKDTSWLCMNGPDSECGPKKIVCASSCVLQRAQCYATPIHLRLT